MKKIISFILAIVLILGNLFSMVAFATDENRVGVVIEHNVKIEPIQTNSEQNMIKSTRGNIDLSDGTTTFTVGKLSAGAYYRTDTYSITKTKIRLVLQSVNGAASHIKVTLYKSSGASVAVATVSLPSTSLMSGTGEAITFTNLNSSLTYYAKIENMDTSTTGTIYGNARQMS